MKVTMNNDQIVSLFKDLGENNRLEIKKIMQGLQNVDKIQKQRSRITLFKIRFGKKITLKDIKGLFSKLSTGYTTSYSLFVMKSRQLLPSSSLHPILDYSNLFFKDYFYTNITKIQPNNPSL